MRLLFAVPCLAALCAAGCGGGHEGASKRSAEDTPARKSVEHNGVTYDLIDAGRKLPEGVRLAGAIGRGPFLLCIRGSEVVQATPVRFSYMFSGDISGDGKKEIILSPYNVDFAPGLSWEMVATTLSGPGEGGPSPAIEGTAGDLFAPTCVYALGEEGDLHLLFSDHVRSDTRCWADLFGNGMPVYCWVAQEGAATSPQETPDSRPSSTTAAQKTTKLLGYMKADAATGLWRVEPLAKEVPGELRGGSALRDLKGLLKEK